MTRRDVFFRLPAGWAGLAAAVRAEGSDESYWQMVARLFPLDSGLLYLNAANVCPASRPVMDRYLEYLRDFHANPSFQNREKYVAIEERVRSKFAALLSATPDEIAITRNTSEGSNLVVHGIDLKAGDEVIITDHNHPSNSDSWKVRAQRDGIVIKSLPVPVPGTSAADLLGKLEAMIGPRTRVVAITHLTSTVGLRFPAKEVGEMAKRRSLWYHLDGAQSFGAMDIDLRAIGCDSFSSSMHKWPMGPLEAGVLYVKASRHKELWPAIVTAGWSDKLVGARKFEVFGQRDNPRLASIEAALDFLTMVGPKRIEARVAQLTGALKQAFAADSRLILKTNMQPEMSGGVVKVDWKNGKRKEAYDTLYSKHRLALALTGSGDAAGLRFSPHIYNTMDDVNRAVAAVKTVLG